MKILVVKLADLGDLLICEPAIRSMRRAFPEAQIDLLTTPQAAPLADLMGHDVRVITFDKRTFDAPGLASLGSATSLGKLAGRLASSGYDRVALLHHLTTSWGTLKFRALVAATRAPLIAGLDNGRGDFLTHRVIDRGFGYVHEAEYMLRVAVAAGGSDVHAIPVIAPQSTRIPDQLPERFIALAPKAGSFSAAREWPLERFVALAALLRDAGHELVIVGGPDAIEAGEAIAADLGAARVQNLAGRTSLAETAAVFRHASVVVGNDSFPGHLAAAVGTPVVSVFGSSNHRAWAPLPRPNGSSRVVRAAMPCSPCLYTGHRLGRPAGCPLRTCLDLVTPEEVYRATMELIGA